MLELWVKTKETKEELMIGSFDCVTSCFDRFIQYTKKWDSIQKDRHEKPYTFTAYIEDEQGKIIVPVRSFKKEMKNYSSLV